MDIGFLITTCNREKSCQMLVDKLRDYGDIYVLNDGCDYDIKGANQTKLRVRFGKRGYWRVVNCLFQGKGSHRYYFMLPDDFLPAEGMVEKAIAIWEAIDDNKKICLNLYSDRIGETCWTNFKPQDKGDVWKTQWVDMCFLCEESFFTHLGQIAEIRLNWDIGKQKSSGVGAYISKKLNRIGLSLYQVKESLVIPQEEHGTSQMHSKEGSRPRISTNSKNITDTRHK